MKTPIFFHICFILLALSFPSFAQTDDEQAIRDVVIKINNAFRERNVDQLLPLMNLDNSFREYWKKELDNEYTQYPLKNYKIRSIKIEGEKATIRVYWERTDAKTGKDLVEFQKNHRIFYLKKIDSVWKFSGFPTAENEMISQIISANSDEERKQLIREEKELNTFRMLFVILFRLKNEGNYQLSEEYFNLAKWFGDEFYKGKNELAFFNNQINIANARAANEVSQGNYAEALQFYLEAVKLVEEYQGKTGKVIAGAALTQVNIGDLYFRQGNIEQAERFALLTLKTLEGSDRIRQRIIFHSAYTLLGDIYSQKGEDEKAIEYYHQTGDAFTLGIGAIYLKQGKLAEAFKIFQDEVEKTERAIAAKEQLNLRSSVISFSGVAEIYLRQGEKDKALQLARRAVEFAEKSKNPELIYLARTVEGKALLANSQSSEAENAFRAAIETVETGRQKVIGGEESKISFFENRVEPYQKMIKISVGRGDIPTALNFSERAKSRVLNEILQVGRIEWQKVLNEPDKQKEQTLREKMTELNRLQTVLKYQAEVDKTRLEAVTKQLEQVRLDYEFLQTSAFANYPELRRARGISTNIKQDEIASLIRQPNEALLEFAVTDEQIFLFVATNDKSEKLNLQIYTLDGKSQKILDLANNYRQLIIEKNYDYKDQAQELYDVLFKKASAQLAGKTKLTIVPEGELWNVPFAALITPDNRFLIESKTLEFAQSLTALKELQNIKPNKANVIGNLLAVGNPRLDEKAVTQVRAQYRGAIGDLPEAETEVLGIQKFYGTKSKILTRANAREDVWKAEAGKYSVLHLATHGFANSIKPLYSHLFLSTDSSKTNEDGLLEAWEVMNLRLNADLVVLSACETAQGRANTGEGLIGLSWVFAVANVPLVVASQWKVDSSSTSQLMINFHKSLRSPQSRSISKSLQTAMLTQLKNPTTRHPFYWAGFISIGKS